MPRDFSKQYPLKKCDAHRCYRIIDGSITTVSRGGVTHLANLHEVVLAIAARRRSCGRAW